MRPKKVLVSAMLLAVSAFATWDIWAIEPVSSAAQPGTWRLMVLDGKGSLTEQLKASERIAVKPTPSGESPGNKAHVWTPANWKLQLGATTPSHVFRTYFGPSEGAPIAGDFNGDGFDELAVFIDGRWYLDFNGNGTWDAADLWIKYGSPGDRPIVGDWDCDGKNDIGVFTSIVDSVELASPLDVDSRAPKKARVELKIVKPHKADRTEAVICTDHECICRQRPTQLYRFGTAADMPVVGDWSGKGTASIGTFNAGLWRLDLDGDGRASDTDLVVRLGEPGDVPIVGDFNRDGTDELGIYRRGLWHIDTNGDRILGAGDLMIRLGDFDDVPVVGDWDGDGRDQIGIIARGKPQPAESF